jgi:hypothetical protein
MTSNKHPENSAPSPHPNPPTQPKVITKTDPTQIVEKGIKMTLELVWTWRTDMDPNEKGPLYDLWLRLDRCLKGTPGYEPGHEQLTNAWAQYISAKVVPVDISGIKPANIIKIAQAPSGRVSTSAPSHCEQQHPHTTEPIRFITWEECGSKRFRL